MELALFVYFAEMLTYISTLNVTIIILGLFCVVMSSIVLYLDEGIRDTNSAKSYRKISLWAILICSVMLVLTPTTKTAYTMAGAYAAQKLVQSDAANEVGQKVYKIINQKLDSYIVEETKKVTK